MADSLGAARPEEIAFGPNMTTLTFQMARSLSRDWKPGDEVVVTRQDHDANVSPWVLAAADRGATVRWLDFDPGDCTWSVEHLRSLVCEKTKLVAVGWASSSVGTVNDVAGAAEALLYVDAVHFAPHGPIDVAAAGVDFLACSTLVAEEKELVEAWGEAPSRASVTSAVRRRWTRSVRDGRGRNPGPEGRRDAAGLPARPATRFPRR
jgi:hypothetical protein